jgi:hypothetical protein
MDAFQAMRCCGHFCNRGHDDVSWLGRPVGVFGDLYVVEIFVHGHTFPCPATVFRTRLELRAIGIDGLFSGHGDTLPPR